MDTVRAGPVPVRASVWTSRRRSGLDWTEQHSGPVFRDRTGGGEARAGPRGPAVLFPWWSWRGGGDQIVGKRMGNVTETVNEGSSEVGDVRGCCGEVGDMHERRRRGGRCAMGSALCVAAVSHGHSLEVFFVACS